MILRKLGQAAASTRRLAAVLASAAVLTMLAGCESSQDDPLIAVIVQGGMASCTPAPNPDSAITTWHSPVWFTTAWFVNQSRSPLTIESVTLIDPHNVTVRGVLVYEMAHGRHPLTQDGGLADLAGSVPAADWARRQRVPGAVIGAGRPFKNKPSTSANLYQIAPAVAQTAPGGGWAIGEVVTYRASGQTYSVRAYVGYGIGVPGADNCTPQIKAINAAFAKQLG
jgi:hypothetical protein